MRSRGIEIGEMSCSVAPAIQWSAQDESGVLQVSTTHDIEGMDPASMSCDMPLLYGINMNALKSTNANIVIQTMGR